MTDVNFNRGYKEYIENTSSVPFKEGTISIAEDSQEIYIDGKNNKRIRITDVIDITNINNPELINGKIYINGNKLQKVENGNLVDVSSVDNSVLTIDDVINVDTNNLTKGTIDSVFGKIGDFIIDKNGNIGIVIEQKNNKTIIQIVSMYGSENQKAEQFIFIGNKTGSKELGTIDNPYTSYVNLINNLSKQLKNESNKIVLNCISDDFTFNEIKNWNNVIINGNEYNIVFNSFIKCKNMQIINCKSNTKTTCEINESSNISIMNSKMELIFNSCENINITNFNCYTIKFSYCMNIYINEIQAIKNITATIVLDHCYRNDVYINNSIGLLITTDSFKTTEYNTIAELNIIINNSVFDVLNIDRNVKELRLMSGCFQGNNGGIHIGARTLYLGTFEILADPDIEPDTQIIDAVGLSSKQVYDKYNKQYINDYINHNSLSNSDRKSNLEFHLKAIDESLTSAHDAIDELTEETNKITKAFVTTDSFKTLDELNNKEWKPGNVVKYYGDSTIQLDKEFELTPIEYEEVEVSAKDEEDNLVVEEYISLTFPLNNASYYCKNYKTIKVDHITTINDIDYTYSYDFTIYSISKESKQDSINGYFKARIKKTNINKEDIFSNDLTKFVNCKYVHTITLSTNDRLIRLSDGWDKLTTSNDDSGNYKIVSNFDALDAIDTYNTRKVGTLAYVEDDDKVYKWGWDEAKENKVWTEFSSGSGGGSGSGYILQYCSPSPSNVNDSLYKYNYTNNAVPMFYNESDNTINFRYYYSNSDTVPSTYTLIANGKTIASGTLLKGSQVIAIPVTKLINTSTDGIIYQLQCKQGNNPLVLMDKYGNPVEEYLKYNVTKSAISLSYSTSTNPSLAKDYKFDEIKSFGDNVIVTTITKSDNITIESFKINDVDMVITNNEIQSMEYDWKITNNISNINFVVTYKIAGSNLTYTYEDKKIIYALNGLGLFLFGEEISTRLSVYDDISFIGNLITNLNSSATIKYYFDDNDDTIYTKDIDNLNNVNVNIIKVNLPHYQTDTKTYTLHYRIEQIYDGETYYSSKDWVSINLSITSVQDLYGPIINTTGDSCLVMNFDKMRTLSSDIGYDEDKKINRWKSSVGNYYIKFNNLFNNDDFVGWNVKETENSSNYLSFADTDEKQYNDRFVRFFGDSYGSIMTLDDNGEEIPFDISLLNNELMSIPNSTGKQGYTIEVLFRTRYTGDINALAMKIGEWLNISFEQITFFDSINFIENEWTHVTFVVNNYEIDADTSTPDILSTKGTVLPHMAIYVNGIISKLQYNTSNPVLGSGNITFNKNTINNKDIFNQTDLKVFRIYRRPLTPAEILQNFHSCIIDETIRKKQIDDNNLTKFSDITEVYFIRNSGDENMPDRYASKRKASVSNTTFSQMNTITNKATSKANVVNCTVLIATKQNNQTKIEVYKNVEIGLQGTSTLAYVLKNYKIKLYNDKCKKEYIELGNPIDGYNSDGSYKHVWKPEYVYTLKCDYMESSHMNNTGIARFINDELYKDYETPHKTPSQIDSNDDDMRIIIDGFPCVLYQIDDKDYANSINEKIMNLETTDEEGNKITSYDNLNLSDVKSDSKCKLYGSYMFNLDKEATNNYGFVLEDKHEDGTKTLKYPYLQSFEINANNSKGAGAFLPFIKGERLDNNGNPFNSEYDYYIDTYESRYMYDESTLVSKNELVEISNDYDKCIKVEPNEYIVPGFPVFEKNSDGSYSEVTSTYINGSSGEYYRPCYCEDHLCFNGIIQLINFLNDSRVNKVPENLSKFVDINFAIDYFIMTMSVGMVDNLGKNLMMNAWNLKADKTPFNPKYINPNNTVDDNNKIRSDIDISYWYPSFYDLDTCLGLDNYGRELVTIDAEPIIEKLSGYNFKDYQEIYSDMPDVDEKYNDNAFQIYIEDQQLDKEDQQLDKSVYKYLPKELLDILYKIKIEKDSATINKLASETLNYMWYIRLNDSLNQVSLTNTIKLKSNDWFVLDVSNYNVLVYQGELVDRYSMYSTAYSSLWNCLLNNYSEIIYNTYLEARRNSLTVTKLMNKLKENTFGAIPKNYYNYNAQIKYFKACSDLIKQGNTSAISAYCQMCNGDREIKVKYWLTNRLNFVDTLITDTVNMPIPISDFGQRMNIMATANGSKTIYVQTKQPQYISVQVDVKVAALRKYVNKNLQDNHNYDGVSFGVRVNNGVQAIITGSKNMMNFYSFEIFDPTIIDLTTMTYLKELSIGKDSINTKLQQITLSSDPNTYYAFNNVKLQLQNTLFNSLDLSRCLYIDTLDLSNCINLRTLNIAKAARTKSINLSNCQKLESLTISDLFQLEYLNLTGCTSLKTLIIENAEKLKSLNIDSCPINNITIKNTGLSKLSINSIAGNNTLQTVNIQDNIESISITKSTFKSNFSLDLSKCIKLTNITITENSNLVKLILPINIENTDKTLSISGNTNLSTVGFNGAIKDNEFNFKYFRNGENGLTKFLSTSESFVFGDTKCRVIRNLNANNVIFRKCTNLEEICDSTITTIGDNLFRETKINNIDSLILTITSSSALYCFYSSKGVTQSVVKKVIESIVNKSKFNAMCLLSGCTFKVDNVNNVINYEMFKGFNLTSAAELFGNTNIKSITKNIFDSTTQTSIISGDRLFYNCDDLETVPNTLFIDKFNYLKAAFYSCNKITQVPDLYKLTNLQYADFMFANCTSLKYKFDNLIANINDTKISTNLISYPKSLVNDDFYRISTYTLTKLISANAMYYNTGIIAKTIITQNEQGETILTSAFPDNYFEYNKSLKYINNLFASVDKNTSMIETILPNKFISSTIVEAAGVFSNSKIYNHVSNQFMVDAINLQLLGPTKTIANSTDLNSENSWLNKNKNGTISCRFENDSNNNFKQIDLSVTGMFANTNITTIDYNLLYKATKLQSVQSLFANCKMFKVNTDDSISYIANIFDKNIKLTNCEFVFYNTAIEKPFSPDLFINNTELQYISGAFAYNKYIKTAKYESLVKIAHLKKLISTNGLYMGNMYYLLDGNLKSSTNEMDDDNLNIVFTKLPNLTDTSFMFMKCGLAITFSNDNIFNNNIRFTNHMFNQCYFGNNAMNYMMYDNNFDEYNNQGLNKPSNHVALNDTDTGTWYKTNFNACGNITGNIPKYLFKDKLLLSKCEYMFAGTAITGWIPYTIFDISDNHTITKRHYQDVTYKYPTFDESGNEDPQPIISNLVYFYKDNDGKYAYSHFDESNNQYVMIKATNESTKYSLCDNFEISSDELIYSNMKYFSNLKSINYMFAFCTRLSNAIKIDGLISGNKNLVKKQQMLPFEYNGYLKTHDEVIDSSKKYYVINDITNKFRQYNPNTDTSKTKFELNNENFVKYEAAIINGENSISVDYKYVYFLHPQLLYNLTKLTSANGFVEGCNELQGCLPDNIFQTNIELTSCARFCANCINLYGIYNNTLNNNTLYSMFYSSDFNQISFGIKNISYMFYNCKQLGKLLLDDNEIINTRIIPASYSTTTNKYGQGFLAWISGNNTFLLKNLTNIVGLFANSNINGYIPYNMLSSNQYKNSDLKYTGCFANCNTEVLNAEGSNQLYTGNYVDGLNLDDGYDVEMITLVTSYNS